MMDFSNHALDMNGSNWSPAALDAALVILKREGRVEVRGLPDGEWGHFQLEPTLRGWSAEKLRAK